MTKQNLVLGNKYKVKGFNQPVILHSIKSEDNTAKVIVDGNIVSVLLSDILAPVIDTLFSILATWLKSLLNIK